MTKQALRCCMIGKGGLAVECMQLLADRGHEVLYVISTDDKLTRWARAHHARQADTSRALPADFNLSEVDYLFSIANGEILPQSLLEQPRKLAINYHNGPLPKYAGVHATAWAILNGEKSHGVTWHVMEPLIDAGDVLKQLIFDIDEDESTLTLNLKCYEHALEAFRQLLPELEDDSYRRTPQDLSARSYFALKQKPFGAGLINWADNAEQISRLCRALNFGSYPNELGAAKFVVGERIFIPRDLKVSTQKSEQEPGMLVSATDTEIRIATSTQDVTFSEVATVTGEHLKVRDLIGRFWLRSGQKLFVPDDACLHEFTQRVEANFRHEGFWRQELRGISPVPATVFAGTQTPADSNGPQRRSLELPTELLETLAGKFTGQGGVRAALLTAVLIYIYRVYRKSDFTVLFSRQPDASGCTSVDCLFTRQVPFNITLQETMTAVQTLMAVKQQAELVAQRGVYLKDLPYRDPYLRRAPEISSISIVAGAHLDELRNDEQAPLTIGIDADAGKLVFLTSDSALASPPLAYALDQIATLLQSMSEDSEQSIARLALLSAREQNKILYEWNDTAVSYDEVSGGAYELFARQAQARPKAIAVSSEGESLTYGELQARAEQLAAQLQQLGVGAETPVCVQLDRSVELVVALLAILRAGGVYVPLDPAQPARRRSFILQQTQAPVLIVTGEVPDEEYSGIVLRLDQQREFTAETQRTQRLRREGSQLAYIMYTSGTTGEPKGVLCTHGGLLNRLQWSLANYALRDTDVLLQNAAVGFDISVWEMLLPLAGGGRLAIAGAGQQKDAAALLAQVESEGVTVVHLVPTLLGVVLEQAALSGGGSGLRWVVSGGEALRPELRRRFEEQWGARLFHAYGPTETSISVTHWEAKRGAELWHVPLGKPVANTQLYVLDEALEPVGIGVVGEIYIGGVAVGRGYLGRPELTAERFVCDPFGRAGGVLYRTGDRGRYLSDGNLEYVGRSDRQVKVRGQRVELGEVETVLGAQVGVEQAVVVSREERGAVELVGYVRAAVNGAGGGETEATLAGRLKAGLRERLPEYMVPGRIIVVDEFPLTPNGKINYANLAAAVPQSGTIQASESPLARNSIGSRLTEIWERLLGVKGIGVFDDFFALGGHSLVAIRLVSEIQRAFPNHDINITHIFKQPTIAALTNLLAQTTLSEAPSPLVQLSTHGDRRIFLVHPGEGLAYVYTSLANHLDDVRLYGINNPSFGNSAAAFGSVKEMAAKYVEYVQQEQIDGPYIIGGWSFGGVVAFEMASQLKKRGRHVELLLLIDSYNLSAFPEATLEPNAINHFLSEQGIDPESDEGSRLSWELSNNGRMSREFRPATYDGKVVLLKANRTEEIFASSPAAKDNGWGPHVGSDFELHTIPGEHEHIFQVRHVAMLAQKIRSVLDQISAMTASG